MVLYALSNGWAPTEPPTHHTLTLGDHHPVNQFFNVRDLRCHLGLTFTRP